MKKNVDFVVGGQYGDEGKGMVAKLLADQADRDGQAYQWTARVGGQNAEHRFIHHACDFCARVFPSAAAFRPSILALLGAGHCFHPEHLLREAVHLGVDLERVFVDPQAMWLREEHASANLETGNARGTTGWGIGAAIAEKVRRRLETKLIGDCELLQNELPAGHIRRLPEFIEGLDGPGLVEGSQGALLSLDHGHYPYCTAKNVTVPAVAGELGISHKRFRRVIGVFRLVPMRVPGMSGPADGAELSFDEVEKRTGLRVPHHKRLQGDTSRWKAGDSYDKADEERLFEFSMAELHLSHLLNGFDALALTFADFHRGGNYRARAWSDLHPDTRALIERIEREIGLPVILVRTGQGEHDNIWREGA
jgi:adenylosuccinate synthase